MPNDYRYTVAAHNSVLHMHDIVFSAVNLISFVLTQTSFLYFLISHQLLNKPLHYAWGFAFKTFHTVCLVLTSLSHENTIETSLMSKRCCLAKFDKVDA